MHFKDLQLFLSLSRILFADKTLALCQKFWVTRLSDFHLFLQVILVQVNPGETFTIRAEDGSLQCIQGMLCFLSHAVWLATGSSILPSQTEFLELFWVCIYVMRSWMVRNVGCWRCSLCFCGTVFLANRNHDWCVIGFGAGVNRWEAGRRAMTGMLLRI